MTTTALSSFSFPPTSASLQATTSENEQTAGGISADDANIDPALLRDSHAVFAPRIDGAFIPKHIYSAFLQTVKRRGPLVDACAHHGIAHAKRANLEKLRGILLGYWYQRMDAPSTSTAGPTSGAALVAVPPIQAANDSTQVRTIAATSQPRSVLTRSPAPPMNSAGLTSTSSPALETDALEADLDTDDNDLVSQYDAGNGAAEAALGSFDTGGMEEAGQDEDEEDEDEEDDNEGLDLDDDNEFHKFRRDTRVSAAQRTEQNRRAGGKKTQKCMVKSWNVFQQQAITKGEIHDGIVDEHVLLLYLNFCAASPQSQIKKEFFGALRIRKVQDARDPMLAVQRPATSVYVYDLLKTKMDEALKNSHEGLIAGGDAPDVVANTFLDQLSDKTLDKIGYGFLDHRELKATINGHLAWTMMGASRNRGDDIRALRLCEMQPYVFLHPNGETSVPSVLGLQSEQKASRRGMKTTINPTYTCFIAHRDPIKCPLGAFAIYLHFIHNYARIDEKYNLNYTVNKSWCSNTGVESHMKAHLRRHTLGYQQEKMGQAILGAHSFKLHEEYKPVWRHVPVPVPFLNEVCTMAEANVTLVEGKQNLVGATNYWQMVITLRPYLFQCAAAIYQSFQIPAQLAALNAATGDPVNLARIQNSILRQALEELRHFSNMQVQQSREQVNQLALLSTKIDRRTAQWTPPRAPFYQASSDHQSMTLMMIARQLTFDEVPPAQPLSISSSVAGQLASQPPPLLSPGVLDSSVLVDVRTRASEDSGVYKAQDHSLRGFVAPSPRADHVQRPRTEVDLVLPPLLAFYAPGMAPVASVLQGVHLTRRVSGVGTCGCGRGSQCSDPPENPTHPVGLRVWP
ncbi:hypothetical protein FPV67DRAFT_1741394 [Lyophyllum atratum]|nr:hypothetical protein FPV67DRAFT_1741394 [Lyophyllum atratum]